MTTMAPVDDAGGAPAVEAALLAVVVGLVIAFVIAAGRVTEAESAGDQAARAAARYASIARDPGQAETGAIAEARRVLGEQGLTCEALTVTVTAPPGAEAGAGQVATARVTCVVRWSDLALPGAPGTYDVAAEFTSPLDQYRERP